VGDLVGVTAINDCDDANDKTRRWVTQQLLQISTN